MSARAARLSRLESRVPAPQRTERPPIERGCLLELRVRLAQPDIRQEMIDAHGHAWLSRLQAFIEAAL